jgi:hypothetical protein
MTKSVALPCDSVEVEVAMSPKDFGSLVEQLGDPTEVQRAALQGALACKGAVKDAIALIGTRVVALLFCDHGGSESFGTCGDCHVPAVPFALTSPQRIQPRRRALHSGRCR